MDKARLRGRVAVMTGAAAGIGAATAERLARGGAHVLVTGIDDAGGKKLVATFRCEGIGASYHHLDARSRSDWTGRLGDHAEVAAVVTFVASDDASFVTGATLVVDGGWSIIKDSV